MSWWEWGVKAVREDLCLDTSLAGLTRDGLISCAWLFIGPGAARASFRALQ